MAKEAILQKLYIGRTIRQNGLFHGKTVKKKLKNRTRKNPRSTREISARNGGKIQLVVNYDNYDNYVVSPKVYVVSHGLNTYIFFSTGETRPMKFNLTCETKNLIYMIQCNRCNLQYIGETKRRLKDRFNKHRRTIDNPNNKSKPNTAAEHFLSSPNHTANDMILIPIEKIFSNRDSIRKAREAFLIQKGRTIDPDGLNIREQTY